MKYAYIIVAVFAVVLVYIYIRNKRNERFSQYSSPKAGLWGSYGGYEGYCGFKERYQGYPGLWSGYSGGGLEGFDPFPLPSPFPVSKKVQQEENEFDITDCIRRCEVISGNPASPTFRRCYDRCANT